MDQMNLPSNLKDKIFEIRSESEGYISKIVSYFPLNDYEKNEILKIMNQNSFDGFISIFSDKITEEEWDRTKNQIKKKFQDELFDVDKSSK